MMAVSLKEGGSIVNLLLNKGADVNETSKTLLTLLGRMVD